MWHIVKENEHKRKQKILKDRVKLQHHMIKKQDELIHEKHELKNKEQQKQNDQARYERQKLLTGIQKKVQLKSKTPLNVNNGKPKKLKPPVMKPENEEAPCKTCDEEKLSEKASQKLDAFSEEDLSELLENSMMENADFHELRYQPLQVQLERLFGDEAEGYLNPEVKESPRKVFDLSIARKKGQHGAAALWEALRAFSRQKLVNKDALILPDVKNAYACFMRECLRRHVTPVERFFVSEEEAPVNVNLEESDILKDVKYRRHRQELMYRIAHLNKDKTKLLFQVIGPPHYSEAKDEDGIRRYYPEIIQEKKPSLKLPEISENCASARNTTINVSNAQSVETKEEEYPVKKPQCSKLVFLTEKKATCRGQFARRLNKEETKQESKLKQSDDVLRHRKHSSRSEFPQRLWEPLSMQALLDHQNAVSERRDEISALDSSQIWNVST
ncbi:uncharacterized protein LOC114521779 isoform X2 [Dendronephthya gigantea]|nr:uncharacterized protein LOC114521779 isoform X2 [Dendronephthya gigantea]